MMRILLTVGLVAALAGVTAGFECGSRLVRDGGCPQFGDLGLGAFPGTDLAECERLCQDNHECAAMVMTKGSDTCYLLKSGCTPGGNQNKFEFYQFHRCSCSNSPCQNGGQCQQIGENNVECHCKHLYTGQDCSQGKTCVMEQGYCVQSNGRDQNSGVLKMNNHNGNTQAAQENCLKLCMDKPGATGCEVIWSQGNRGCYIHTNPVARGNGRSRHKCWAFSKCYEPLTPQMHCPSEKGYCVRSNGQDQNRGVKKLNNQNGDSQHMQEDCLTQCRQYQGATGCEVIWNQGNRGCYVHTEDIDRGNNRNKHLCWVFSKCS